MIDFLKRLLGSDGGPDSVPTTQTATPPSALAQPDLPPLPQEEIDAFLEWYRAQRKPAMRLTPDPDAPVTPLGSRLLGPAFLLTGEEWPSDETGRPLEFLAQIDFADCAPLECYPREGVIQFFVGMDNIYGLNADLLHAGSRLVRVIGRDAKGSLHNRPASRCDSEFLYTPAQSDAVRIRGITLIAETFEDRIDLSNKEAETRFFGVSEDHNLDPLFEQITALDLARGYSHHTGGFPAFTQADIRLNEAYADFDHVLLRLTSDDILMWGDAGECVFMMRSADLARGDFGNVAYSWDCS